jgi:2-dehydropantoate 2-reductase
MNVLVYGAGAIGCHIGYCMYAAGNAVYLIGRGEHYKQMKRNGMHIKICDNEVLKREQVIMEGPMVHIVDDVNKIKGIKFEYIFITVKLGDYDENVLSNLYPLMGKDTAIIPPCTKLPFWWFYNLEGKSNEKFKDIDFDQQLSKYFVRENIICMTMWLSSVIESPGNVCVKHIQRGYPLKEVYPKMNGSADKLRDIFKSTCKSPEVEDIRSEIYIKSINSFAFNTVALDREFNNLQLSQDEYSRDCIRKIMTEGDQILEILGIPIIQSIEDRIRQTLSSTKHTMSMLNDYRNGQQVELDYLWEGFNSFCKILKTDMGFSKYMYEKVMDKVCTRQSSAVSNK